MATGQRDFTDRDASSANSLERLLPRLYDELRAAAHRQLALRHGGRGTPTLTTTALVHEAYLKLAGGLAQPWLDEAHFLCVAAVAMRHILIDYARARASAKRGGNIELRSVHSDDGALDEQAHGLIELDAALRELESVSPRLARVVELRYFGGLADERIAEVLGVTPRTVQRDWSKARVLLRQALDA